MLIFPVLLTSLLFCINLFLNFAPLFNTKSISNFTKHGKAETLRSF